VVPANDRTTAINVAVMMDSSAPVAARRFSPAERSLLLVSLVNNAGSGAFLTGSVVYFTRNVGLPATGVAAAISVAGLAGLVMTVPAGLVAERVGAQRTLVILHILRTLGYSAFVLAGSLWQFAALTIVLTTLDQAANPAAQALVATVVPAGHRVRVMSWQYAAANVGIGIGAAMTTVVLGLHSAAGFRLIVLFNGLSFACSALLVALIRAPAHSTVDGEPLPAAGADRSVLRGSWPASPYLLLTLAATAILLYESVLNVAIPVWVSQRTAAPVAVVGVLAIVNTVLAALLQVRVSRVVRSVSAAGTAILRSSLVLAVGCGLFALASRWGAVVATALLVGAVVAISFGEMLGGSGNWYLSVELAPAQRRERYLAVFGLSTSIQRVIGPIFVAAVLLGLGATGWLVTAAIFLAGGLLAYRVAGSYRRAIPAPSTTVPNEAAEASR
jgi:MFS family permease